MSDQDQIAPGRKPDFIAYNVKEGRDGKPHFNRVGAAWQHKDGQGYEVTLDSVPVSGRITLRERREERMRGYDKERAARTRSEGPKRDRSYGYE